MAGHQGYSAADTADSASATNTHGTTNIHDATGTYTPTPHSLRGRAPTESTSFADAPQTELDLGSKAPTGVPVAASATDSVKAADSAKTPSAADLLGSSGGEADEEAQRANEDFKTDMAEIRREIQRILELVDKAERREKLARCIVDADTQVADADEVVRAGMGQAPDRAFRLVAGHTAMIDDIDDAAAEAGDNEESIWKKIRRWLGRAGRKLWAMISRLVTVKEWSLTGTVSTGVLGLAGASISVTFGQLTP